MQPRDSDPPAPAALGSLRATIALGALLSLAACFYLASERLAIGSTEGGWLYGYGAPFSTRLLVVFVAAYGLAVVPLLIPAATAHTRQWTVLALWIALATAAHVVIRSHAPFTLEQVFVSAGANAFYTVAKEHEPSDVLRRFDRVREHGPLHVQSNMPGKVLLVEALQAVTTRTGVLPWLLVAISNLGAVLMYLFVRDLFEDRRAALFSAALYLFVPARIFFFPLMNTVTPLLILGGACLLLRWLRTGHTRYAVLLGILLYGLAFFEPLPLVMGLLFAMLSIRAIALGGIAWARFAAQTVLMLLVFVATAEAVTASTGFSLFAAFRDIGGHAVAFNETAGRPYRLWIAANLREFVFGMGICQAAAFAGALVHGLRPAVTWAERLSRPATVVCLSLAAVLLVIDLIGVNRGEVIRLWIFLACFFQIPAAYACALGGRAAIATMIACSVLQAVLGAAMIHFVVP